MMMMATAEKESRREEAIQLRRDNLREVAFQQALGMEAEAVAAWLNLIRHLSSRDDQLSIKEALELYSSTKRTLSQR